MDGAGIDLIEVARFRGLTRDDAFLLRTFTIHELEYCFSYADPAPHLAGHFAAKEAAWKSLQTTEYPFTELEVRHSDVGAPYIERNGERLPVHVSISHTADIAAAVAVR